MYRSHIYKYIYVQIHIYKYIYVQIPSGFLGVEQVHHLQKEKNVYVSYMYACVCVFCMYMGV